MIFEEKVSLIKRFVNNCTPVSLLALNSDLMSSVQDILKENFDELNEDLEIIDLRNNLTPLQPFIEIINNQRPSTHLIDEIVYSLHRNTFNSYIENQVVSERYDVIQESEIKYEKKRFCTEIIKLLSATVDKNYLILNSQLLYKESLEILNSLTESDFSKKFIFAFDVTASESSSKDTIQYIQEISSKEFFLSIADIDFENPVLEITKKQNINQIDYDNFDFETILNALRNSRLFLANRQNIKLSEVAENYIHNTNLTETQKKQLFLEIGLAYYYSNLYDKAVLYFTQVLENNTNKSIEYCTLYYLSKTFYLKKDYKSVRKYLTNFFKYQNISDSNIYLPLCKMVDYLVSDSDDYQVIIDKYKDTLKALKEAKLKNNFIATGILIPWIVIPSEEIRVYLENQVEECFIMAQEIDNQHAVSSACHWRAILFSNSGLKDQALEWYMEANKIRTEIGDIEPILDTRNGLSYEALTKAEYTQAFDIVNEIIPSLYTVNDCSKILDSLRNISYAAFFSRHFDLADSIFNVSLKFLALFNYKQSTYNSFLPSAEDIILHKAIICLDRGDFIHAKIKYLQILRNKSNLGFLEQPLMQYLKAVLLLEENKIDQAFEALDEAICAIQKLRCNDSHKLVFMLYEFSLMLIRFGHEDKAQELLETGFELAKENGFTYYTKNLDSISVNQYLNDIPVLDDLKINLNFLKEKAEKELLFNQLHKKISDYQFINNVKTIAINDDLQKYAQSVISLVYDYSMASDIYLVEKNKDNIRPITKISQSNKDIDETLWLNLFEKYRNAKSVHLVYDTDNNFYFSNYKVFGNEDSELGMIIVDEQNYLTPDFINTLEIALSAVESQIVIYKQNFDLLFYSSTDQLSLLKNRHSLHQYMQNRGKEIKRCILDNNEVQKETLAFIDLDNFKYYNDKFGHELGDMFIKKFAELLKKVFRRDDFIARYGGDEFIILLPDVTNEIAKRITSKIYLELEKQQFFIPIVKEFAKSEDIEIPDDLRLGFSLGFCCNIDADDPADLNEVLSCADKAMYYSKTHGKGFVTDWKDIKDSV